MEKKLFYLFVLVSMLVLAGCGGGAAPTQAPAPQATEPPAAPAVSKIVVGTSADYPPFEFMNDKNEFDGFDMALMREIGKRLGAEIEFQDIAFDGLIAALQAKKIDAVAASLTVTEEREQQVDFTIPYFDVQDALLVKAGSGKTFTAIEEITGLKVGVQTGTTHEAWIMDNLVTPGKMKEENLTRYERAEQAILDLKNGRIDVVALDYYVALAYVGQGGVEVAFQKNLSGDALAIAVPTGSALKAQLDKVIQQMRDEGVVEQLAKQYLATTE